MYWKREDNSYGSDFSLYKNKDDEEPITKFHLTIELMQDMNDLRNISGDNSLIEAITVGLRERSGLDESDVEEAVVSLLDKVR